MNCLVTGTSFMMEGQGQGLQAAAPQAMPGAEQVGAGICAEAMHPSVHNQQPQAPWSCYHYCYKVLCTYQVPSNPTGQATCRQLACVGHQELWELALSQAA
jgi:hypothetical protein